MVTFSDPLYSAQWHFRLLGDINLIWNEYSGAGIHVAVYDDGLQYIHPDLDANYDASLHFEFGGEVYDPAPINLSPGSGSDGHGTSVAGLIAAEAGNSRGGVGVAWGAQITGINLLEDPRFYDGTAASLERELAAFRYAASFDVVNHSWGYDARDFSYFLNRADETSYGSLVTAAFGYAVENGRSSLGTLIVKSAGNDAANANGEGINGSRYVVSVSALDSAGQIQSYSNYGSNILVSAGAAAVTTDLMGSNGYNQAAGGAGDYATDFGGTSASAPVVSGVIALMLDANETLGWRDVRDILASSARLTGSIVTGNQSFEVSGTYFQDNSQRGGTWNDGGRGYSLDYGFGNVDAFAAVRMAEIWSLFGDARTSENEAHVTVSRSNVQLDMSDLFEAKDWRSRLPKACGSRTST
jgi:subtilisin family serine protease